jgi:hypothetical protein
VKALIVVIVKVLIVKIVIITVQVFLKIVIVSNRLGVNLLILKKIVSQTISQLQIICLVLTFKCKTKYSKETDKPLIIYQITQN